MIRHRAAIATVIFLVAGLGWAGESTVPDSEGDAFAREATSGYTESVDVQGRAASFGGCCCVPESHSCLEAEARP